MPLCHTEPHAHKHTVRSHHVPSVGPSVWQSHLQPLLSSWNVMLPWGLAKDPEKQDQ